MNDQDGNRRAGTDGIVIAGGGLAAQRCAEALRRAGCEEPIRMLCAEPHRPYDRPPLSKQLLAGGCEATDLAYRDDGWYAAHAVDLLSGVAATRLVTSERRVETSTGEVLRYRRLLIATGARPRSLPPLRGLENVMTLRTLDEALELRAELGPGRRLVIVGGGFVGLEVAATARALGAQVTLVEAASAPLAGVLGETIGRWFARLHREHGVRVLTGRTLQRVARRGSAAEALHLGDGTVVAADLVVVGVGVQPDVAWLAGSALEASGGVRVDPDGRTALADVFAAGDVAATLDPVSGAFLPGSHWEAAARQGAAAGRLMLGIDPGHAPPSSFWTDQYGLRIQYVGRSARGDAVAIDGDPRAHDFTATYTRAGRVTAVLLVNRPRALPAARALLDQGTPQPDRETAS